MTEPIKATEQTLSVTRERLSGALLELTVKNLERIDKPWSKVPEEQQRIALNAMGLAIDDLVAAAVQLIATDCRPCIVAEVDSVTFKDGVKAVVSMSKATAGRHELADATGNRVLIAIADHTAYINGKNEVKPSPDQAGLDLKEPAGTEDSNAGDGLPEIRMEENETYTIYVNGEPMKGGSGFADVPRAEAWLLKTQGYKIVNGKAVKAEPVEPPPAPKLEDVVKAFREAAKAGAVNPEPDWDKTWDEVAKNYPATFIEENYTEISAAFADGWEEATAE